MTSLFQAKSLAQHNAAQQSVHLTLGILRQSQAVSYAFSFFWLDGFAVPTPAQVTQTVGRSLINIKRGRMKKVVYRIKPIHLLTLWGICLLTLSVSLPSVLTHFPIYMGMLLGYLQAKTHLLAWSGAKLGELLLGSYLSVRHQFGLASTSHDGIYILLAKALYFAILTTALYIWVSHSGKTTVAKTIIISSVATGILMIGVGVMVLTYNPKIRFQLWSKQASVEYVVQPGDTCDPIAFEYGISVESIVKANRLPYTCALTVGQTIEIPLH